MFPYVNGADKFKLMEKKYKVPGYYDARLQAERDAREQLKSEVTFDEIYERIGEDFKHLKPIELQMEIEAVRPNLEMRCVFQHAVN